MTAWITFIATAYCACFLCTKNDHGITKSGHPATTSYTVACDPSRLGSILYLEGYGYRQCHDIGSAIRGDRIDVYFHKHDDAKKFGVKRVRGRVVWEPPPKKR